MPGILDDVGGQGEPAPEESLDAKRGRWRARQRRRKLGVAASVLGLLFLAFVRIGVSLRASERAESAATLVRTRQALDATLHTATAADIGALTDVAITAAWGAHRGEPTIVATCLADLGEQLLDAGHVVSAARALHGARRAAQDPAVPRRLAARILRSLSDAVRLRLDPTGEPDRLTAAFREAAALAAEAGRLDDAPEGPARAALHRALALEALGEDGEVLAMLVTAEAELRSVGVDDRDWRLAAASAGRARLWDGHVTDAADGLAAASATVLAAQPRPVGTARDIVVWAGLAKIAAGQRAAGLGLVRRACAAARSEELARGVVDASGETANYLAVAGADAAAERLRDAGDELADAAGGR